MNAMVEFLQQLVAWTLAEPGQTYYRWPHRPGILLRAGRYGEALDVVPSPARGRASLQSGHLYVYRAAVAS